MFLPIGTIEEAFLNLIARLELTEQSLEPALAKGRRLVKLARRELKVTGVVFGGPCRRGTGVVSDRIRLQLVLGSKYYYDFRENSTKLLYFLKNRLPESAEKSLLHGDRIIVKVDSPGADLELVPSIKLKPAGYLSPNGLGSWYKTNPDKEAELFKAKDEASSGKFLKLVKVIKAWNLIAEKSFDPYYLELLIYYRVNDFNKTYAELVHSLFTSMQMFLPEFLNCPAADEVISCGLPERLRKQVVEKAVGVTGKAVVEWDPRMSLILWKILFGPDFGLGITDPA